MSAVQRRSALVIASCAALCGACACESRPRPEIRGAAPESLSLARPPPGKAPTSEDAAAPTSAPPPPRAADPAAIDRDGKHESGAVDATSAEGIVSAPFIIDGLVDVALAGPVTATEQGVVMVNRRNQLALARLRGALDPGGKPVATGIVPLPDSAGPFPLAHGAAVKGGLAYWVSRGRLLAQRLERGGDAEGLTLASDARVGTRVAVPVGTRRFAPGLPELAAYIAREDGPDAPLRARLWIRGHSETLSLTDDAASAHSVALVETTEGVAAVFLEPRTSMSAIHLRAVRFSKSGTPSLGEDRIVWIAGPGRPSTELFAEPSDASTVMVRMTLERDATHFGLVELGVPLAEGASPLDPDWYLYANGIEPAPFATASICGKTRVILARPSTASPDSPQELVLADLGAARAAPALILARSSAFFDVSVAPLARGALLAYVADHRTWARVIRCVGG
jgi:hypothetical protein